MRNGSAHGGAIRGLPELFQLPGWVPSPGSPRHVPAPRSKGLGWCPGLRGQELLAKPSQEQCPKSALGALSKGLSPPRAGHSSPGCPPTPVALLGLRVHPPH